ncbi:hypothetical protein [Winogradskyella sp.]|uniref:hypothetical protein n=1 Tax=Winogradskyella sp. TaxID=1883156 RepID=UPI003BABFBBF
MKKVLIIILILTFSCSQKQRNADVVKFEEVLGERETKCLNLLVSDFEKNLNKIYPDLSVEKAYQQYLTDMISDATSDREKFKFQSRETNIEFHQSGLWKDIYTKDSVDGLQVNQAGKYMKALYEIKSSDALINNYWKARNAVGMMQNAIVVSGILSNDPNFRDYFHKRIVVLEFSF